MACTLTSARLIPLRWKTLTAKAGVKASILLLGFVLAPCAWGQNGNVAGVIQTHIPYGANQIVWENSDSVLFSGHPINGMGGPRRQGGVYRWRLLTGEVVQIIEHGTGVSVLCHDRGYVHIAFWRGDQRVIVQGPIGSETTITYNRTEKPPIEGVFNPYTCRYARQPMPTTGNRRVIEVLRDEHGFIEYESPSPGTKRGRYFLTRPQGQSILLPLHDVTSRPRYSEFRKAYVFQYGGSDLSDNADKHGWLVEPNGRVTDYPLPKGPWLGGSIRIMPVQVGVVIASPSARGEFLGLNLVRGDRVEQLVQGVVGAFAVALDGCRVALSKSDASSAQAKAQVQVIDVCKGRI